MTRDECAELEALAEEQAGLRRVATLVAAGAPSADVFSAVAQEVAQVMHLPMIGVFRYDGDGEAMTVVATFSDRPQLLQPGTRWPIDGPSAVARVLRTGRPARVEDYAELPGTLAGAARASGLHRTAGAPIIVDGSVWGVMAASSPDAPLPDDVEDRLAEFTELVAAAIANAQSREELTRLAQEQAALRRVATLVAQGTAPGDVFAAVGAEVARLLPADAAALTRYESDGTVTALAGWTGTGGYEHSGTRFAREGTVSELVWETRRPGRMESYAHAPGSAAAAAREMGWRSSVGAPITVDDHLWGMLAVVSTSDQPLPPDTERRLAEFTELVATAIANTESRAELRRLAEEQAALRRVATLVAGAAPPAEMFEAVIGEVGRLVPADGAALSRYEADGTLTTIGGWSRADGYVHLRTRHALERGTLARLVLETRRPGRIDTYAEAPGSLAAVVRGFGWRSSVGVPIVVEGRLWGVMGVASTTERPLPRDTEGRLEEFTGLVATAIANAESRAQLEASRARIVATADATRRRIERDLHDGAQQELVSLALELRAAQGAVPPELGALRADLSRVAEGLGSALDGLREIGRGIHPAILAEGGLGPALKTLARRSALPVELDLRAPGRLAEPVKVAAYYVVSEALTNAARHARASHVHVAVEASGGLLRIVVRDDGVGGADPARGSGLLGLKDRAEALGGRLALDSPRGAGTTLRLALPLGDDRSAGHAAAP